jgi:uncharacterized protein with PIN domain
MIVKIRSEFDGDFPKKLHQFSSFKTETEPHEIRCSICGKLYFVDREMFNKFAELLKYNLDNQFLCENCERDYQESAFE